MKTNTDAFNHLLISSDPMITKKLRGFRKKFSRCYYQKNGKLRITVNYKPILNLIIIIDEYPIPKVEHLFNKLRGATLFCHLDITDAYILLQVDEEFSHALTPNTSIHGFIRPTRAVYGAANISAIWQQHMDTVVLDLPTLGHKVDASKVYKLDAHIRAVRDAPKPTTPEELQLFLGKATYYSFFIPDLSTRDRPLWDIVLKDTFAWTPAETQAFWDIKEALILLCDPSLPLLLSTDASNNGLGAVLSHRFSNGQERPIVYTSRTIAALQSTVNQIGKFFSSQRKEETVDVDDFDKFVVHQTVQLLVRAETIARETWKDAHLGQIVQLLEMRENLARHHYKGLESRYTLAANCLMFEHRVAVPPALKEAVLKDLHTAHSGIMKMKGIARSFIFWLGIDADIEQIARSPGRRYDARDHRRCLQQMAGSLNDDIDNSRYNNRIDGRADPEQPDILQPPRRVRFHETIPTPRAPAATRATLAAPATPSTPRAPRQQREPAPCGLYTPQHPRRSSRTRVPPLRFSLN
ncbi:hypothetical protein ILUMI_04492 [Ignelater luminosus]|uniref:RNA-directed DNA polymerase n=1 Tax=Ignelater luminosus TaxID=2038154 RepID=A0A8K0GIZ6_IGNLU|nr:hypothetical protein ILUMI_04492 [Ignelater luminosus]